MTNRTDITDLAGVPLAIAELNEEELRALRALADAGMIHPLEDLEDLKPPEGLAEEPRPTDAQAVLIEQGVLSEQGVLIEQDFTRRPVRASAWPASVPGGAPRPYPATKAS